MPSRTVDPVYVPFEITTPPGTVAASPLTSALAVPKGRLQSITLLIPDGHQGATGIRFTLAGQQVLPWSNTAAWIKGNNLYDTFVLDVDVDSQLAAITYNVGSYAHTHYVRALIRSLPSAANGAPVRLIDTARLNAS